MKTKNPLLRLWELGEGEQGKLKSAIILALLGVIFGIVPYFCAGKIVVGLLNDEKTFNFYLFWSGIAMSGYFLRTLLYNLALAFSHKGTFRILKNIRQMVLEKLPKLPLGSVMEISSGKLKQIIVDQVESMETTLAHLLPEMTSNLIAPILVIIYLFVLDWRMAFLSLVSIPIGMLFMMMIMRNYSKDYEKSVKTTQDMNETIVEYISGIEVIKAYNQGKNSYAKFETRVNANASYYYNWMKRCQFGMALAFSIAPTTLITVLPMGFIFYSNGSLYLESFIMIIILSMSIVGPLIAAMAFIDNLAKVGTTVASVDELLNAEEQNHGATKVVLQNRDIKLSDVSFSYNEEKEILHNLNLSIPTGSVTALVGPSGSGKSTIAKLIAGFWDVPEGKITIGGVDVKNIPLSQLYDEVAFVSQDNFLFDDTVMNNIRMGNIKATDEQVIAAAIQAGCNEFIKELERGYYTKVGGGGVHLSGGEKQRISIARAMLKNSPIVVLDEATAYIDPENEGIIQMAVAKLVKGKTLILIAHRLSTITNVDKIVVVKNGFIEAEGTHDELLEENKLYKNMWMAHMGMREEEIA
ncbi:MAG: ABC transporter ATP-binding protein/permease [Anaeromicrobium sp.]|jgi:ATP-binding cassette subfamily B protein|uniref:ABC transporter ATP-binding protein n=1 Tax=Anaeromicrobium sp. TaxID=1929132 RepID=UPI0025D4A704|nr:ABC transporter ATP-binding protein [Anaeromicrobium sp.]MCT4595317.1 ABC transporter ATP-binding protein/permease [Anaeromicrobium sp.]